MKYNSVRKVIGISLMMSSLSVFGGELKLERYSDIEYQFSVPKIIIFEATGTGLPFLMRFASSDTYKVTFTRCSGTLTVNGKESYGVSCVGGSGADWGVTAKNFGSIPRFKAGDTVVWDTDIAGILQKKGSDAKGITLIGFNFTYLPGTFPGNPSLILTPNPAGVKVPLQQEADVTLPPNKGSTVVSLSYPSSIVSDANENGGFQASLLKLTGDAGSKISLETTVTPQSGAKMIKNNGGDCSQMSVNESCDIVFPAGTVQPGQSLKGNIKITATIM